MAKVLVLCYSTYGHIETMANAVAEGARSAGATVDIKVDQAAPVATVEELEHYDAIILGAPTRFGRVPSQWLPFVTVPGGYGHAVRSMERWVQLSHRQPRNCSAKEAWGSVTWPYSLHG